MEYTQNTIEIESEQEDVNIFARRGQVMRSPILNQYQVPKSNNSKTADEQPSLHVRTKLSEAMKASEELYEYIKPRSNVHAVIRTLTVKIRSALAIAEREQQTWRARAEKAENALKEAVQSKAKEVILIPTVDSTPLTAKRRRQTPEEKKETKKHKDGSEGARGENKQNNEDPNGWHTVERKKKENKKKGKTKPKMERQKPEALIVSAAGMATYAEILRKVKEDPSLQNLGENVARIRRTQNGEMLFELKKNPTIKSSTYRELVEKSLGETAKVRALSQEIAIECRNLDEITTDDELREALNEQFELSDVSLTIRLRKAFGGTQTAVIKLPRIAARKLLETGKIKVGWTVCPLRAIQQMMRCFKCMDFGHQSRNCNGPDRSDSCLRCGNKGHLAKMCTKPPRCMLCTTEVDNDHVTGGSRCPFFKRALAATTEPYQVPPDNGNWVTDKAKIAAITTLGKYPFQEVVSSEYEGFVIVKINDIFVCSCYAPPRWTIEQFDQMLHNITEELIGRHPIVIGGDFNAWAVEWGSRFTNARGFSLLEGLSKLNIRLVNEGSTSTFRRDGRESIIDVTFCSPSLASNINWRVCEDYTNSDHQAIRYTVSTQSPLTRRGTRTKCKKWKLKEFDKNLFIEALQVDRTTSTLNAVELTEVVTRACDVTMTRKSTPKNERRPVYWWNETINTLRISCLRARRRMQRARIDTERTECREAGKRSERREPRSRAK
ncbi:uncharacterized protein LOC129773300 [Toxorhynchites rutilus septentrionalis]|uniref:uncharacterized protein LOC129773300 n=1 Tax=Toxorhynchites rutilus septentrionalis TaxID=329112 RepID=UPI00247A3DD9|nr:uncharacterized protein LOC129773300 [Toxorhynchites rutilus septentrionalis]